MRLLIFFLALTASVSVHAEMYLGIAPLETLGEIKARFPRATFTRTSPGWAQKTDVMFQIRGDGMSGLIVVKLSDMRPAYKELLDKNPDTPNDFLRALANQSDDEAITVDWVRWMPNAPIPLQRFISKYGQPEKSGFADEDYQPYRLWVKRGVNAYLSDNEKDVVRVDFAFTREEYKAAYLRKYNTIPDWLKDQPKPKDQQRSPAKGAM